MPITAVRRDPFPPFPLLYLSEGFDAGDWGQLEERFRELEARPIRSVRDLERWILAYSELGSAIGQEQARRYIDMTCHTDDPKAEERYLSYQRDIVPKIKPRVQALQKRYVALPLRKRLPRKRYHVLDRSMANEVELFREENIPLETKDRELAQKYQKILGAMAVRYDGQERTLQQMGRYLEVLDPKVRREAWELVSRRYLQDRDALDGLYDELVQVRDRIARNAGFPDFRGFAFRMRERFDYTPSDCVAYQGAVEEAVVPALRRLQERRRKLLKLQALRPWDLNVDPKGAPPLRPFEKSEDLVKGVREIYRRISPDLARTFQAIADRKLLDLDSRKGKAPGGYQYTLQIDRVPFIFMNAAGLHRDVETLLHEGGHAFHAVFSRKDPIAEYRHAPLEFSEVASQGMEILGLQHLEVFYSPEDASRAHRKHFEDAIGLFAWVAQIDGFQHQVYADPGHSREDRRRIWLDLRRRFAGVVDWDGSEEAHASLWHRQQHLFTSPFYYIEYAISLLGALQLWRNARRDRREAIRKYRRALALGGSRPLPELFEAAGLRFDFSARMLGPIVKTVMDELDRLS